MALRPTGRNLLIISVIQLSTLIAAWGFYGAASIKNPLHLPDATARWVYKNPAYTTTIVTIVATVINTITLSCFMQAAKHALTQHIAARGSISLAHLSIGVAMARASPWHSIKLGEFKHIRPFLGTTVIAIVFSLVNSAWTTFLTPVQVHVPVTMNGGELDLGNQAFDTVLGRDINNTFFFSPGGLSATMPNSSYSLLSLGFTGGMTGATAYASGQPGTFVFNNVAYNISTGGIVPAAYGINQNSTSTSVFGAPASFGGGLVPTTLKASSPLLGISRTYNIIQQGLTANVSCYNYTNPADLYPVEIGTDNVTTSADIDGVPWSNVIGTVPTIACIPDGNSTFMTGTLAAFVNKNPNYLETAVCPSSWIDSANSNRIVIYHNGAGRYGSLPPTICEVVPLVTQSSVTYVNQLVTSIARSPIAIPNQSNLLYWLAILVIQEEGGFQTVTLNSLGDMLLSLSTAGPTSFSETPAQSYQLFLVSAPWEHYELLADITAQQEFWKGMIEIMGTALRSGYASYPENITSSMLIPMIGTQNVTTLGWYNGDDTNVYPLFLITLGACITFVAIVYALYYEHISEGQKTRQYAILPKQVAIDDSGRLTMPHTAMGTFDASDPVHLVVASAGPRLAPGLQAGRARTYWDRYEENVVSLQLDS